MQARTFRLGTEQGLVPRLDVSRPEKEGRYPGLVWPQVSLRVAGAEVEDWVWDACVEGAAGLHWDFLQISRPLESPNEEKSGGGPGARAVRT